MLSISPPIKSNPEQISQYYEQMNTEKVGQLEDYYGRETRSQWLGGTSKKLGLFCQSVNSEDFKNAATGYLPRTNKQGQNKVANAGKDDRRAGYDLTFSAPKSVSVLFATADEETRKKIEDAMFNSVNEALSFAEDNCVSVRYGTNGYREMKAKLLGSGYLHHTSRNLDPQLHIHSFIHNISVGEDGKARTLESRHLMIWQKTLGVAFRVSLAEQLQQMGYHIERDKEFFRVSEIAPELEMEFSTRKQEILNYLHQNNLPYNYKVAHMAGLATRQRKQPKNHQELMDGWQQRADTIKQQLEQNPVQREVQDTDTLSQNELDNRAERLTDKRAIFSNAQAYYETLVSYQGIGNIQQGIKNAGQFLAKQITMPRTNFKYYSTQKMIDLERHNLDKAKRLSTRKGHDITTDIVEDEISKATTLSDEQKEAIRHVCSSGDIKMVQGLAGTGKSFALATAVKIFERQGYEVKGLAPSGKAAKELEDKTGADCITIARGMLDVYGGEVKVLDDETGRYKDIYLQPQTEWQSNQIYFVDEVGMVDTRAMDKMLREADRAGAKIIGVGDTRQLQSIQAGAPARQLKEKLGYVSMDDIRRQKAEIDRGIVKDIRYGRAFEGFTKLAEVERLKISDSEKLAKHNLATDLHNDLNTGTHSYCLAERRQDIKDINETVRALQKQDGYLQNGKDYNVEVKDSEGNPILTKREFAVGDRVVFTKNVNGKLKSRKMGGKVKNGWIGEITAIDDKGEFNVRLENGTTRHFNISNYKNIDHGYAMTVHKSQGSTYDISRNFVSSNGFGGLEIGYVSTSRTTDETMLYGTVAGFEDTIERWSETQQQVAVLDMLGETENKEKLTLDDKQRQAIRESSHKLLTEYEAQHKDTQTQQPQQNKHKSSMSIT